MAKLLKLYYSSSENISFNNEQSPETFELPDDWDDFSEEEKRYLIQQYEDEFIWQIVEIWSEVVDDDGETTS